MNDSQKAPVWNLLNIRGQPDSHILTANQKDTVGYRCVQNDDGNASWTLSTIKYDWDYKSSGYCPKETDCFVNESYNRGALRAGCIKDGESLAKIGDTYTLDGGNNYCHNGKWTTKSYIIATALENLTGGNSFTLFCDNENKNIFNNNDLNDKIASACTMIKKNGADEKVYVGFALNKPEDYESFIGLTKLKYDESFNSEGITFAQSLTGCNIISDIPDYLKCADETNLKLYYNIKYKYFILTDTSIESTPIEALWGSITSFFGRIFGIAAESTQYEYINYTSKYDKIYVMKNSTTFVTGMEEMKYDELTYTSKYFMYLNYSKVNVINNKINLEYVNTSIQTTGKGGNYNYTEYNYTSKENDSQELVIRSDNPTKLFEYLTAMLRSR